MTDKPGRQAAAKPRAPERKPPEVDVGGGLVAAREIRARRLPRPDSPVIPAVHASDKSRLHLKGPRETFRNSDEGMKPTVSGSRKRGTRLDLGIGDLSSVDTVRFVARWRFFKVLISEESCRPAFQELRHTVLPEFCHVANAALREKIPPRGLPWDACVAPLLLDGGWIWQFLCSARQRPGLFDIAVLHGWIRRRVLAQTNLPCPTDEEAGEKRAEGQWTISNVPSLPFFSGIPSSIPEEPSRAHV